MKAAIWPSILIGLLLIQAVANTFLTVRFFFSVKEMEKLQTQAYRSSAALGAFEGLLNEAIHFSRDHPDIAPIIEELQSKIRLRTNAPPRPPMPRVSAEPAGAVETSADTP